MDSIDSITPPMFGDSGEISLINHDSPRDLRYTASYVDLVLGWWKMGPACWRFEGVWTTEYRVGLKAVQPFPESSPNHEKHSNNCGVPCQNQNEMMDMGASHLFMNQFIPTITMESSSSAKNKMCLCPMMICFFRKWGIPNP